MKKLKIILALMLSILLFASTNIVAFATTVHDGHGVIYNVSSGGEGNHWRDSRGCIVHEGDIVKNMQYAGDRAKARDLSVNGIAYFDGDWIPESMVTGFWVDDIYITLHTLPKTHKGHGNIYYDPSASNEKTGWVDSNGCVIHDDDIIEDMTFIKPAKGHGFNDDTKQDLDDGEHIDHLVVDSISEDENATTIHFTTHELGEYSPEKESNCTYRGCQEYWKCKKCYKFLDADGTVKEYIGKPLIPDAHDFSNNAKVCRNEPCRAKNPNYIEPTDDPQPSDKNDSKTSPETGENIASAFTALGICLAGGVAILIGKKKKNSL